MSLTQLNKEQLESIPEASTSVKGIVEIATDAEATTGTDETRYINPKQLKNWSGYTIGVGENILGSSNTTVNIPSTTTYTKTKEIKVGKGGTYTVKFTLTEFSSGDVYGKIYKNGVEIGTERTTSTGPSEFTENFTFNAGDFVQIYTRMASTVNTSGNVSLFRLCGTIIPNSLTFNVIS